LSKEGGVGKFPEEVENREKELKKQRQKEQMEARRTIWIKGNLNPQMICPHCQTEGSVRARKIHVKKGISGAKVTGEIFRLGLSLHGMGLSTGERVTRATCDNCKSVWHIS
jgi:hypothetical protein